MFRHLFGVTEDEVRDWPMKKWALYRDYAREVVAAMTKSGVIIGG